MAIEIKHNLNSMPIILELNLALFCNILILVLSFRSVESVPDDYCLTPLNRSNCGFPPTPVFHYYKSGSRCEIQFWRGCPTTNLFRNEYDCSHHCIGRLWKSVSKETTDKDIIVDEEVIKEQENPCDEDIIISSFLCTKRKVMIFTVYDNKTKACVQNSYYGCGIRNKFFDKEKCEKMCHKDKLKWKNLDNLNVKELKYINDMLDKVNEDFKTTPDHSTHHTTHHIQQLKHKKHTPSTTTSITEPMTTSVVTEKPTEASTTTETTIETTAVTQASEVTDTTTKSTQASEINDGTTEAENITEPTQASEITVETTEITAKAEDIVTEPKKRDPVSIEETDIVRSKLKQ